MSNKEVVLFDLPSKPPNKSWSPNPWKTRFVLNYKGIPYKTEWLEYPDIKPRLQDHLPKADLYTIPTIILPDGTWVTDSWKIAEVLEEKYPEPSLHLDSPYLSKIKQYVVDVSVPLRTILIPGVARELLNERSAEYFNRTREAEFGMPLEQAEKELGGEKAWKGAEPHLQKVTALLKENSDGPFFLGKTVSYADFVWGGYLIFARRVGENVLAELLKRSGDAAVHEKLLEALKPWSERDDH